MHLPDKSIHRINKVRQGVQYDAEIVALLESLAERLDRSKRRKLIKDRIKQKRKGGIS
jgi:hypothetical protein